MSNYIPKVRDEVYVSNPNAVFKVVALSSDKSEAAIEFKCNGQLEIESVKNIKPLPREEDKAAYGLYCAMNPNVKDISFEHFINHMKHDWLPLCKNAIKAGYRKVEPISIVEYTKYGDATYTIEEEFEALVKKQTHNS